MAVDLDKAVLRLDMKAIVVNAVLVVTVFLSGCYQEVDQGVKNIAYDKKKAMNYIMRATAGDKTSTGLGFFESKRRGIMRESSSFYSNFVNGCDSGSCYYGVGDADAEYLYQMISDGCLNYTFMEKGKGLVYIWVFGAGENDKKISSVLDECVDYYEVVPGTYVKTPN